MKIRQYTLIQLKDLTEALAYDTVSLSTLLTDYGITYSIGETSLIETLFTKINNRYNNDGLFSLDVDEADETTTQTNFRLWLVKFLNKYEVTKTYYETLINAYEDKLDEIMLNVEATTTNEVIFNDTPQTEGGIFKTTDYATNYTKTTSTTSSPMKTPIERLKDIQMSLENLWKAWLDDCRGLFIELQPERSLYEAI